MASTLDVLVTGGFRLFCQTIGTYVCKPGQFLQMRDVGSLPAHVLLYGHKAPTITGIMGQPQRAFLMIHSNKAWMVGRVQGHSWAFQIFVILGETKH